MFNWVHRSVNRRDHDPQPDGRAAHRIEQLGGGTAERRHGGRRVDAGQRELDPDCSAHRSTTSSDHCTEP